MDYYKVLGVAENSSQADIKKAFRKLSLKHHPDRGGDAEEFKKINEAYSTLGDVEKKRMYDMIKNNPFMPGGVGGMDGVDDIFKMFFGGGIPGMSQNMNGMPGNIHFSASGFNGGIPGMPNVQIFRNCIDKYSHNVHFLASCSNTQKVIESIQSRCTIIKLKPISQAYLKIILKKIKNAEKLSITDKAENFILNICNNSIRLLINYLEKFKLLNIPIDEKKVKEICTNISFYEFENYTKAWYKEKNLQKSIKLIYSIYNKGYSVMDILDSYFSFIKITTIIEEKVKYKIIIFILKYIAVFHTLHENDIELIIFTNELIKI